MKAFLARGLRYLEFKIFTYKQPIGAHQWSISTLPSLSPNTEPLSYQDLGCVVHVHRALRTWSPSLSSAPVSPWSVVCGRFLGPQFFPRPVMTLLYPSDIVPVCPLRKQQTSCPTINHIYPNLGEHPRHLRNSILWFQPHLRGHWAISLHPLGQLG